MEDTMHESATHSSVNTESTHPPQRLEDLEARLDKIVRQFALPSLPVLSTNSYKIKDSFPGSESFGGDLHHRLEMQTVGTLAILATISVSFTPQCSQISIVNLDKGCCGNGGGSICYACYSFH